MHYVEHAGVVPGLTCWCHVCRRISVLSFSNYKLLASGFQGALMDPVQYYTHIVARYATQCSRDVLAVV